MTTLHFDWVFPWWAIAIVALLGSISLGLWYWRESRYLPLPWCWVLPCLRTLAFALILLMLTGPALHYRYYEGEMSRIRIVLDQSRSMATSDQGMLNDSTRMDAVRDWLLGEADSTNGSRKSWLERLSRNHRVELFGISSKQSENASASLELLWDSLDGLFDKTQLSIMAIGDVSPLGDSIVNQLASKPSSVVLISDGQSNSGLSLLQAGEQAASAKIPVYAIGMGPTDEPNDLAILNIQHSQRVFRTDRIRGTLDIKEIAPLNTPYLLKVMHLGKVVLEKSLKSENQAIRSVEFELPAESLIDSSKKEDSLSNDKKAIGLDLRFSLEADLDEVTTDNNFYETSLWGVDRQSRILMLDRRGGWETRYIKNALARDIAWHVDFSIGQSAMESNVFPKSRVLLQDYELLVISVETISILSAEQQSWIRDFVGEGGGGLILIDTKNNLTVPSVQDPLLDLMPVRSLIQTTQPTFTKLMIASNAVDQVAMQLASDTASSQALWQSLPVPRSIRECELSPGAEALLEAMESASNQKQVLVATKMYGQGRVVYMNHDESWRWRYGVADQYHQRFWNQMCNWTMRTPFSVNSTFASLDTGLRMISNSDPITIRGKLNRDQNLFPEDLLLQAVLFRNDEPYATLAMNQESDGRGFYRANYGPFPSGRYHVRLQAAGIPQDAFAVESEFIVQPNTDVEMASLACNTTGLEQLARTTGGQFVPFDQADSITDSLQKFQTGKWVETVTLLWQSYPWFATIIVLLALEWLLRKRVGLI